METNVSNPKQMVEIIRATNPVEIAELPFVKDKFIQNYNYGNPQKNGEMMYHRQLINFKQLLAGSDNLRGCDQFSLYACFVTAAVKGYSFDPADNEIYMVPLKGKAVLWRQAGAYVRRLIQTNQIRYADQPQIVYQGDTFLVKNGRVIEHIEKYASETYANAYVRFVLDETGSDRFFMYRRSDWEMWKKKSTSTKSDNPWTTGINGQPDPGFLRTKILKHACMEKSWAIGVTPINTEIFEQVEYDEIEEPEDKQQAAPPPAAIPGPVSNPANDEQMMQKPSDNSKGVVHDDDDF